MAWSNIDDLTLRFLKMENKSFLEVALEKDNLIVSFSILIVFFISSLYTVLGVGMNMSAVEMTRMTGVFSAPDSMSSMPTDKAMGSMEMSDKKMNIGQMTSEPVKSMEKQLDETRQSMGMSGLAKSTFDQLRYFVMMCLMWWLMMIAMMTPSASSMLLSFFRLKKIGPEKEVAINHTYCFLSGYLVAWALLV